MNSLRASSLIFTVLLHAQGVFGAEWEERQNPALNLNPWTGEGASLGGIFFPQISYQTAAGTSTGDPASLAVGGHDPNDDGVTQQSLELALEARLGQHVRLFGSYTGGVDQNHHWQDRFDEYYAEISSGLPLGLALKAGRFLTQFGYDNGERLHQYTFVDKFLAPGRLLGEDSATVDGGQLSLPVFTQAQPGPWHDRLSVSFGAVPEAEDASHPQSSGNTIYDGDRAQWIDHLATVDYTVSYSPSAAVRVEAGVSGAWGQNEFDRETSLYGAHFQYVWRPRETGLAKDGRDPGSGEFVRWRTEVFVRHFGAESTVEETSEQTTVVPGVPVSSTRRERILLGIIPQPNGTLIPRFGFRTSITSSPGLPSKVTTTTTRERTVRDDFTDAGAYTAVTYGFPNRGVQAHLRAEYVSGIAEAGLPERYRVSPAVTWQPRANLPVELKLQYNYDHFPSEGDEHSVWAQFSLTWGDPQMPEP